MAKARIFICKKCGNMVVLIQEGGGQLTCCGQPMVELVPNTTDAAAEKHVPVIEKTGDKIIVRVGSTPHPMLKEHHIEWVYLITRKGGQRKHLEPALDAPAAEFILTPDDAPLAALAYCNLHGLWQADI